MQCDNHANLAPCKRHLLMGNTENNEQAISTKNRVVKNPLYPSHDYKNLYPLKKRRK